MKYQKEEDLKMLYEEFVVNVVKKMRQYLPPDWDDIALKSIQIPLNNNVYRMGIQLLPKGKSKSEDKKIAINLLDFYQSYQEGIPMETVLSMIAQEITDMCEDGVYVSLQEKSYDWAKEHLLVEVCNEEMNRSQLLYMPHEKREDLALRYLVWTDNGNRHIVRITNAQLKRWGISEETLQKDAWENMKKKLLPVVRTLNEILMEIYEQHSLEIEDEPILDDCLYFISNAEKFQGASYMFDEELMYHLAQCFEDDLVIIPSSIHEILLLKKQHAGSMGKLIEMVTDINYSKVLPEEILSNNVYVYDRETHKINIFE